MNRIYVLSGVSGAGKDMLAKYLMEFDNDVVLVQWSAIAKRTYERWYNIPKGSLDDREFRLRQIPGMDKTYLQVLIDAYHAWNDIDPRLTIRPTLRVINRLLKDGKDVVITDTRKKEEADDLVELVNRSRVIELFNVHVFGREGEAALSSDDNLDYNLRKLRECSSSDLSFVNSAGVDKVANFATELLLKGYWYDG